MDDYEEIVALLHKIKGNQKAIAYIKGFLQMFINKYC